MKKYLIIIFSIILLSGCSYNYKHSATKSSCKKCTTINVGENKNSIDKKLGTPIKFKKNKEGTYTAIYKPSYSSNKNKSEISIHNDINNPFINNNSTKLIILYDSKLKVKKYNYTK